MASHHHNRALAGFLLAGTLAAQAPGPEVIRDVAAKSSEFKAAREQYAYRQTVLLEELDRRGAAVGSYREARDIVFSPLRERSEQFVGRPLENLKNLKLTEEDFRDIREVNPFVLTGDELRLYEVKFQGREPMDEVDCLVYRLKPRQILEGQRLFEGQIWVSEKDRQIVRTEGRPVPQIYRSSGENLFPHFTTVYRPIDGRYWFPVRTFADDTLYFRSGGQRVRLTIRYEDYKRFASDSAIRYETGR